ncbi:MAG: Transcription termination/antitermination protein NusA [Legionellaceae bacterium]
MSKEVLYIAEALSNEKAVAKEVIFEAIETALAITTKKVHSQEWDVRVTINRNNGEYKTFRCWLVVENDEELEFPESQITLDEAIKKKPDAKVNEYIEEPIDSIEFGRIAAQTAKQVIVQEIRKAERQRVVTAYTEKLGQLVIGVVKKVTRDNVLIEFSEGAEGIISRDGLLPREAVRIGDRLRAYLYDVHFEPRGAQLFLSRTCPEMLMELFKIEVPEIGEQLIQIMAAARDPGLRAKIAVKTNDGRIDPIGACIGMRGARVQAVSTELGGERVDIILWDDNPAQLVINALAPAEVASIVVDEDTNTMDVAVKEEQLALAIGRSGQNVKLASQLTGWTINVISEAEAAEKSTAETQGIAEKFIEQLGVDEELAQILIREGFSSIEEIAYVPLQELLEVEEFDEEIVEALRASAKDALLKIAIADEEQLSSAQPANELIELIEKEGLTRHLALVLASHGIITCEDLAEQSIDDLADIKELSEEQSAKLIMKAREPWFMEG